MATLKFFVLPAGDCVEAVRLYELAKSDAVSAEQALKEKYGAEAIVRAGPHIEALAWRDTPVALAGFTVPRWDNGFGVWLQKPKKNTLRGKAAAQEMAEVGELLDIWQWALERALGVHGSIFGYLRGSRMFLNSIAKPLADGRVVVTIPVRDHQEGKDYARDTDPKIPSNAVEISEAEAQLLMAEPEMESA